nr:serine hydrolase [Scytonema sp. UIC 10036]
MIQESDNEAASFIVDKISDTEFEHKLDDEEFETWRKKREQVTHFFEQAGYEGINLTHKTYPIASLKLLGPQGSELRIRKNPDDPKDPFRNEITTFHSARLMYETCYLQQAISPEISKKMCGWLKRDLNPEVWKNQQQGFNPIVGFLGQSLADTGVNFYSKAGWTTGTRQEAALIATADGKTVYILAIGADDSMYAKDWQIYPKMSRFVYEQMVARQPQIQGNRE